MITKLVIIIVVIIFVVGSFASILIHAERLRSCVIVEPKKIVDGSTIDSRGRYIVHYQGTYTYPKLGGECTVAQFVTESMYEEIMRGYLIDR